MMSGDEDNHVYQQYYAVGELDESAGEESEEGSASCFERLAEILAAYHFANESTGKRPKDESEEPLRAEGKSYNGY